MTDFRSEIRLALEPCFFCSLQENLPQFSTMRSVLFLVIEMVADYLFSQLIATDTATLE